MCLTVDHNYAGPKSGRMYKTMIQTPGGRLLSSFRRYEYPPAGRLWLTPDTPNVDAKGYHVFTDLVEAAEIVRQYKEHLYAFQADAEHFVAGGLWDTPSGRYQSAIFRTLNVLGPVTANIK